MKYACFAAVWALACKELPQAPPGPADLPLTVPAPPSAIERVEAAYRVDIPYVFVNKRSTAVANIGCRPPVPPLLEWWTGAEWRSAYGAIELACLGPPLVIQAGATFADTLHLFAFVDSIGRDGHGQGPYWKGPRTSADYRIVWRLCDYHGDVGSLKYGCEPEESYSSRPFRMAFP